MIDRGRVLFIAHVSEIPRAAAGAERLWPEEVKAGEVDMLAYGRSSADLPAPPGINLMAVASLAEGRLASLGHALGLFAKLVGRRYRFAVLAQPALGRSRSRGILVGFPLLLGIPRLATLGPGATLRPLGRGKATLDLGRWAVIQLLAEALTPLATGALRRRSRATSPAGEIPARGTVVYLRTDLDLATAPLTAGGSVAHTAGVVGALVRRGYDVEYWGTGEVVGLPREVRRRRLRAVTRANLPTELAELISGILQALRPPPRPRSVAFLYQRYSLNNLAGTLLARRWDVPLVLEANVSEAQWRAGWSRLRFPRLAAAAELRILEASTRVVTVSHNAAAGLLTAGARPDRLLVSPNGVDVERFVSAPRAQLPFGDGSFVVCFCGLFYPWHGARHLAVSFGELRRRHDHARLLLVGDGEDAQHVRSLLERSDAISAAHMPGLVAPEEVPGLLRAADVVVSPHADIDGFVGSPVKVFEYMASGTAIVASRVGQLGEILRHEETALLTAPGDEPALTAALERLLLDGELRERLGRNARQEALALHSWDRRLTDLLGSR